MGNELINGLPWFSLVVWSLLVDGDDGGHALLNGADVVSVMDIQI